MAPPWYGISFGVEDDWLAAAEWTFSVRKGSEEQSQPGDNLCDSVSYGVRASPFQPLPQTPIHSLNSLSIQSSMSGRRIKE